MCAAAATMVLTNKGRILLAYRSDDADAYPGYLSLPGGFLEAGQENIYQTATRETEEEIGIFIDTGRWQLVEVSSSPGVDPRAHVINVIFTCALTDAEAFSVTASDDIKSVVWVSLEKAWDLILTNSEMAFNHQEILSNFLNKKAF